MIITSTMIMMWMLMMIDLQVRACKDDQEAVGEEKNPEEGHDQDGVGVIKVNAHGGEESVSGLSPPSSR